MMFTRANFYRNHTRSKSPPSCKRREKGGAPGVLKNKGRDLLAALGTISFAKFYFGGVVAGGLVVGGVVGLVMPLLGLAPVPAGFDPGAGGATPDCAL